MAIPTNPITVEEYLHSFEGYPGLRDELIHGRIVMTPFPKPLHQQVRQNLQDLLEGACEWTEYTVNGNSNIKFTSANSATQRPLQTFSSSLGIDGKTPYGPIPIWNFLLCLQSKYYLDAGVMALWIVEPQNRTVVVYSDGENSLYKEHTEIRLPFPLHGSAQIDFIFAGLP